MMMKYHTNAPVVLFRHRLGLILISFLLLCAYSPAQPLTAVGPLLPGGDEGISETTDLDSPQNRQTRTSHLKLPALFSDNMVFQQQSPCSVWGWADNGTPITVRFNDQEVRTTTENGQWQVTLEPMEAAGPLTLTVSTPIQTLEFANVLVGEVWICSGQSNMEWPVASSNNADEEIARADFPTIRLFTVQKTVSDEPLADVTGQWEVCSPDTVGEFSAVGFFFGRELLQSGIKHIGLIDSTWGGTPAEAWTSRGTLSAEPAFAPILARDVDTDQVIAHLKETYGEDIFSQEGNPDRIFTSDSALKQGWADPSLDTADWQTMDLPSAWEQAGLEVDGVLWFRREVTIPETWAGQDLVLKLSAIDDYDQTYFNGVEIGSTYRDTPNSWQTPRVYTIPGESVTAGKTVIAVRVMDTQGGGGIYPTTTPMQIGPADSDQSISLAGPWAFKIELLLANGAGAQYLPARLYNAMIAPLTHYRFKGVIWYQGESNAGRAYQYRRLFPAMILDWRKSWGIGDFPFYFVQLANYMERQTEPGDSAWAELREAQRMTLSLPNTGMAVTIDVGDANDIHPRDKQTVGKRLALIARARDYDQDVEYSGPLYGMMQAQGNQIKLGFLHTASGLVAKGGPLLGFAVAGTDRQFHWADATIQENAVVVSSDKVDSPVAVRYAWADNPECNLYNTAGLPASPFRTDDWPGVTFNNQ